MTKQRLTGTLFLLILGLVLMIALPVGAGANESITPITDPIDVTIKIDEVTNLFDSLPEGYNSDTLSSALYPEYEEWHVLPAYRTVDGNEQKPALEFIGRRETDANRTTTINLRFKTPLDGNAVGSLFCEFHVTVIGAPDAPYLTGAPQCITQMIDGAQQPYVVATLTDDGYAAYQLNPSNISVGAENPSRVVGGGTLAFSVDEGTREISVSMQPDTGESFTRLFVYVADATTGQNTALVVPVVTESAEVTVPTLSFAAAPKEAYAVGEEGSLTVNTGTDVLARYYLNWGCKTTNGYEYNMGFDYSNWNNPVGNYTIPLNFQFHEETSASVWAFLMDPVDNSIVEGSSTPVSSFYVTGGGYAPDLPALAGKTMTVPTGHGYRIPHLFTTSPARNYVSERFYDITFNPDDDTLYMGSDWINADKNKSDSASVTINNPVTGVSATTNLTLYDSPYYLTTEYDDRYIPLTPGATTSVTYTLHDDNGVVPITNWTIYPDDVDGLTVSDGDLQDGKVTFTMTNTTSGSLGNNDNLICFYALDADDTTKVLSMRTDVFSNPEIALTLDASDMPTLYVDRYQMVQGQTYDLYWDADADLSAYRFEFENVWGVSVLSEPAVTDANGTRVKATVRFDELYNRQLRLKVIDQSTNNLVTQCATEFYVYDANWDIRLVGATDTTAAKTPYPQKEDGIFVPIDSDFELVLNTHGVSLDQYEITGWDIRDGGDNSSEVITKNVDGTYRASAVGFAQMKWRNQSWGATMGDRTDWDKNIFVYDPGMLTPGTTYINDYTINLGRENGLLWALNTEEKQYNYVYEEMFSRIMEAQYNDDYMRNEPGRVFQFYGVQETPGDDTHYVKVFYTINIGNRNAGDTFAEYEIKVKPAGNAGNEPPLLTAANVIFGDVRTDDDAAFEWKTVATLTQTAIDAGITQNEIGVSYERDLQQTGDEAFGWRWWRLDGNDVKVNIRANDYATYSRVNVRAYGEDYSTVVDAYVATENEYTVNDGISLSLVPDISAAAYQKDTRIAGDLTANPACDFSNRYKVRFDINRSNDAGYDNDFNWDNGTQGGVLPFWMEFYDDTYATCTWSLYDPVDNKTFGGVTKRFFVNETGEAPTGIPTAIAAKSEFPVHAYYDGMLKVTDLFNFTVPAGETLNLDALTFEMDGNRVNRDGPLLIMNTDEDWSDTDVTVSVSSDPDITATAAIAHDTNDTTYTDFMDTPDPVTLYPGNPVTVNLQIRYNDGDEVWTGFDHLEVYVSGSARNQIEVTEIGVTDAHVGTATLRYVGNDYASGDVYMIAYDAYGEVFNWNARPYVTQSTDAVFSIELCDDLFDERYGSDWLAYAGYPYEVLFRPVWNTVAHGLLRDELAGFDLNCERGDNVTVLTEPEIVTRDGVQYIRVVLEYDEYPCNDRFITVQVRNEEDTVVTWALFKPEVYDFDFDFMGFVNDENNEWPNNDVDFFIPLEKDFRFRQENSADEVPYGSIAYTWRYGTSTTYTTAELADPNSGAPICFVPGDGNNSIEDGAFYGKPDSADDEITLRCAPKGVENPERFIDCNIILVDDTDLAQEPTISLPLTIKVGQVVDLCGEFDTELGAFGGHVREMCYVDYGDDSMARYLVRDMADPFTIIGTEPTPEGEPVYLYVNPQYDAGREDNGQENEIAEIVVTVVADESVKPLLEPAYLRFDHTNPGEEPFDWYTIATLTEEGAELNADDPFDVSIDWNGHFDTLWENGEPMLRIEGNEVQSKTVPLDFPAVTELVVRVSNNTARGFVRSYVVTERADLLTDDTFNLRLDPEDPTNNQYGADTEVRMEISTGADPVFDFSERFHIDYWFDNMSNPLAHNRFDDWLEWDAGSWNDKAWILPLYFKYDVPTSATLHVRLSDPAGYFEDKVVSYDFEITGDKEIYQTNFLYANDLEKVYPSRDSLYSIPVGEDFVARMDANALLDEFLYRVIVKEPGKTIGTAYTLAQLANGDSDAISFDNADATNPEDGTFTVKPMTNTEYGWRTVDFQYRVSAETAWLNMSSVLLYDDTALKGVDDPETYELTIEVGKTTDVYDALTDELSQLAHGAVLAQTLYYDCDRYAVDKVALFDTNPMLLAGEAVTDPDEPAIFRYYYANTDDRVFTLKVTVVNPDETPDPLFTLVAPSALRFERRRDDAEHSWVTIANLSGAAVTAHDAGRFDLWLDWNGDLDVSDEAPDGDGNGMMRFSEDAVQIYMRPCDYASAATMTLRAVVYETTEKKVVTNETTKRISIITEGDYYAPGSPDDDDLTLNVSQAPEASYEIGEDITVKFNMDPAFDYMLRAYVGVKVETSNEECDYEAGYDWDAYYSSRDHVMPFRMRFNNPTDVTLTLTFYDRAGFYDDIVETYNFTIKGMEPRDGYFVGADGGELDYTNGCETLPLGNTYYCELAYVGSIDDLQFALKIEDMNSSEEPTYATIRDLSLDTNMLIYFVPATPGDYNPTRGRFVIADDAKIDSTRIEVVYDNGDGTWNDGFGCAGYIYNYEKLIHTPTAENGAPVTLTVGKYTDLYDTYFEQLSAFGSRTTLSYLCDLGYGTRETGRCVSDSVYDPLLVYGVAESTEPLYLYLNTDGRDGELLEIVASVAANTGDQLFTAKNVRFEELAVNNTPYTWVPIADLTDTGKAATITACELAFDEDHLDFEENDDGDIQLKIEDGQVKAKIRASHNPDIVLATLTLRTSDDSFAGKLSIVTECAESKSFTMTVTPPPANGVVGETSVATITVNPNFDFMNRYSIDWNTSLSNGDAWDDYRCDFDWEAWDACFENNTDLIMPVNIISEVPTNVKIAFTLYDRAGYLDDITKTISFNIVDPNETVAAVDRVVVWLNQDDPSGGHELTETVVEGTEFRVDVTAKDIDGQPVYNYGNMTIAVQIPGSSGWENVALGEDCPVAMTEEMDRLYKPLSVGSKFRMAVTVDGVTGYSAPVTIVAPVTEGEITAKAESFTVRSGANISLSDMFTIPAGMMVHAAVENTDPNDEVWHAIFDQFDKTIYGREPGHVTVTLFSTYDTSNSASVALEVTAASGYKLWYQAPVEAIPYGAQKAMRFRVFRDDERVTDSTDLTFTVTANQDMEIVSSAFNANGAIDVVLEAPMSTLYENSLLHVRLKDETGDLCEAYLWIDYCDPAALTITNGAAYAGVETQLEAKLMGETVTATWTLVNGDAGGTISLTTDGVLQANEKAIVRATVGGQSVDKEIAVVPFGDVDMNGKVKPRDAVELTNYLLGLDANVSTDPNLRDVTGDGKVDNKDVVKILQLASTEP